MEIVKIFFEDLNKYPLLEKFWDEYLNKAVDYIFKERNLAFVDIFYHDGIPAFVARDDDGNKLGIIIELEMNGQPLYLSPNDSEGELHNFNSYFLNGFNKMNLKLFKIVFKLYTNDYNERFNGQSNDKKYIGNNPNYWMILTSKNTEGRLFISYPNLIEI